VLDRKPLGEPISGGNPLPPLIVGSTITGKIIEERDGIDLKQVERRTSNAQPKMTQNQPVSVSGVTLLFGSAPERGLSARRLSALRAA